MFLCDSQPRLLPQPHQHRADIAIDAYAARGDVIGRVHLAEVYAGICGVEISRRHVPERIFYNDRGVMFIAHHFLEAACHYEFTSQATHTGWCGFHRVV